jgi:hypothetical protein
MYATIALIDGAGSLVGTKPIICHFTQKCSAEGKHNKYSRGVLISGNTARGFWALSGGSW